jgi:hypothetical protein
MNLELDILKKDVAFLKKEFAILKEQLYHQESRNYFKVQWTNEQQESLDIVSLLTSLKQTIPCNLIRYTIEQTEDTHFQSSLFPDLKNYKIHLYIYFSTSTKQLPSHIEAYFTKFNGQVQIYSYMQQAEFDEICSREPLLKTFE